MNVKDYKIEIIEQGKHFVALNKPSGLSTVRERNQENTNLLAILQKYYNKNIKPIHRLDKTTSGCCIFATSDFGLNSLKEAIRKRLVNKMYLAIVEGRVNFKNKKIEIPLKKIITFKNKKSQNHQIISNEGKHALTVISLIKTNNHMSFIYAFPTTGRMHQIRAHLSYLGHPIIGDKKYGSKINYTQNAIALHARRLIFPLPEGGLKTISAEPNEYFNTFVNSNFYRIN